jgi:hypothetical protein
LLLLLLACCWQVSSITIQPEVMHLLRQLLVTWLPRSEPMRQVLLALPHMDQQVRLQCICTASSVKCLRKDGL